MGVVDLSEKDKEFLLNNQEIAKRNKHNKYLKQFYWSGKHHLWTRGYFCSTIGEVSESKIKEYIKNQG